MQYGPQQSGWLESAWPFASLNLPWQYLPLNFGSFWPCSRRATANGCRRACKARSPGTCSGSLSSSLLANRSQSLRISTCCHKFWNCSFKKAEVIMIICRCTCTGRQWQPGARLRHLAVEWSRTGCKSDLELAARQRCPVLATDWGPQKQVWAKDITTIRLHHGRTFPRYNVFFSFWFLSFWSWQYPSTDFSKLLWNQLNTNLKNMSLLRINTPYYFIITCYYCTIITYS